MPRRGALRFVETPIGRDPATREFQRTVRSHAASVSHPDRVTRRQARRRRRVDGEGIIILDANSANTTQGREPQNVPVVTRPDELPVTTRRASSGRQNEPIAVNRLYMDYLSGNTFSPLQHLPTYHRPYLPGIVNHYISNLMIPIPELDGSPSEPLWRVVWLPIVFHDPVVFQVVMLFAANHYATFEDASQFNDLYLELLSLKQSALSALIRTVQNEQATPLTFTDRNRDSRDTLIAAAAKMASYEAIFGNREAFHLHMSTVTRLLRMQGGPATLGMNGFLARFLAFIDTNSAFILGTNLYLVELGLSRNMPHHQPFPSERVEEVSSQAQRQITNTSVVNLERFMGLMNLENVHNQWARHP